MSKITCPYCDLPFDEDEGHSCYDRMEGRMVTGETDEIVSNLIPKFVPIKPFPSSLTGWNPIDKKEIPPFEVVELIHGDFKVEWEWIGEGNGGDYDPDDPDDKRLLRFSCYQRKDPDYPTNKDGDINQWIQLDDASYCTRMPVTSPLRSLAIAASILIDEVKIAVEDGTSYKKELERLSWFATKDFWLTLYDEDIADCIENAVEKTLTADCIENAVEKILTDLFGDSDKPSRLYKKT